MDDPILRLENVSYAYPAAGSRPPVQALREVSLTVRRGEYVVVLGHNGSGKSTLARHLNGLLLPDAGEVWVEGWNTRDKKALRNIRTTVGMVFQQPDNQIVATMVEEDVAFGPENLGMPRDEMIARVDWALGQVELRDLRHRAPHLLSGGQKQRVCIAGVLAMRPDVLVLDEATAMLDPQGRAEVLAVVARLNHEQGVTVVAITHFMSEALAADRIIIMDEGRIALEGTPRELFAQPERLRELHLDVPQVAQVAADLHERVAGFPAGLLSSDEIVAAVMERVEPCPQQPPARIPTTAPAAAPPGGADSVIDVSDLVHYYMRGTPLEVQALFGVDMQVQRGEVIGIIGHTGSGKSTVLQHLNGLLRAHVGRVVVLGQDTSDPSTDLRAIRRRVGLVFQFPEAQLFEQYVGDDVAFGPRKLGLDRELVRARVRKAMESVELGFEEYKDRMAIQLSGGQRRRVALAGVLALEPEVLVLDEPTAGLDPQGRRHLMGNILALNTQGVTLIIVSHNMEELAELCDRIYVLAEGRTVMEGTPAQVFGNGAALRAQGLDVPAITRLADALAEAGFVLPGAVNTRAALVDAIVAMIA